jgi:transposase
MPWFPRNPGGGRIRRLRLCRTGAPTPGTSRALGSPKEFLEFMDDVVAAYPRKRLEVILDNLNTHKKNEAWLARHPRVTFHYTPTRASWLNQVEGWFSILQGQSLTGATFTSVEQLKAHIDAYIETYNDDAEPFVWTKSKVYQRRVKGRRLSEL